MPFGYLDPHNQCGSCVGVGVGVEMGGLLAWTPSPFWPYPPGSPGRRDMAPLSWFPCPNLSHSSAPLGGREEGCTKVLQLFRGSDNYNFERCSIEARKFIRASEIDRPVELVKRDIYAFGYYFDRIHQAGIVTDGVHGGYANVSEVEAAAKKGMWICS